MAFHTTPALFNFLAAAWADFIVLKILSLPDGPSACSTVGASSRVLTTRQPDGCPLAAFQGPNVLWFMIPISLPHWSRLLKVKMNHRPDTPTAQRQDNMARAVLLNIRHVLDLREHDRHQYVT